MAEHKYTQMQAKNRREVSRDGVTYIRFKGVLRYAVPNPQYIEKPEGEDTRTATQKRKTVFKEVSKRLEAAKNTRSTKMTEENVSEALQKWRDELEAKENKAEASKAEANVTLCDYIEQYISGREAAGIIEPSTATDYRHTCERIKKRFTCVALKDVTADAVQRYETAELKRGVSATTVGKMHRLLKQVITYAVRHEVITKNVMLVVEPPKRPKKRPNGLDVAEAQRVTEILMNQPATAVSTAAFLALHASLRAGEACGLAWGDVDLENNVIHISRAVGLATGGAYVKPTKNDSSTRDVNIDADLAQKLRQRRELMASELENDGILMSGEQFSKLYVCGTREGKFLNPQILTRKWAAIAEEHSIVGTEGKRATFHTLRHAYATVGVASGVDIAVIASQMGHATTSMTLNTYSSATASGKRQAAHTIGDAMHPREEEKEATIHELKPAANE
jgi:integrase